MKDKDIMDIEVYQIKSNKWQIINEEKNIILKLLAYKLSSWADDTYLKVIINKETKLKNIIIEWNCADLVFETHKTFFKFDNELPDNLDCKASEDKKSSIIIDADYVYYNLLDYNLLIVRYSLEKSKTTRIFYISKFREVIKNIN